MKRFFLILATTPLLTGCALEEMRHEGKSSSGNYFQQSRSLLKSKKLSLHLHLRNRYFGNRHFATKYRKP